MVLLPHTFSQNSEYAEIYASVETMLYEIGMGGEVVVFAMFKDKDAVGGKDVGTEDEVGNLG